VGSAARRAREEFYDLLGEVEAYDGAARAVEGHKAELGALQKELKEMGEGADADKMLEELHAEVGAGAWAGGGRGPVRMWMDRILWLLPALA
jgi:hypothetical protein